LGGLSPVIWKSGQQAQANAGTFPARFSTALKYQEKILLLKRTENGESTKGIRAKGRSRACALHFYTIIQHFFFGEKK